MAVSWLALCLLAAPVHDGLLKASAIAQLPAPERRAGLELGSLDAPAAPLSQVVVDDVGAAVALSARGKLARGRDAASTQVAPGILRVPADRGSPIRAQRGLLQQAASQAATTAAELAANAARSDAGAADGAPLKQALLAILDTDVLAAQVKSGQDASYATAWAFLVVALGYSVMCLWYECLLPKEAPAPGPPGHITNLTRTDPWDFVNFALCTLAVFAHVSMFVHIHFQQPFPGSGFWWHGVPYVLPGIVLISGVRDFSVADTVIGFPCTIVLLGLLISFMSYVTPGPAFLEVGVSVVDWYLQALLLWRLLVAPLFWAARLMDLPMSAPFMLVLLGSYLLWQHVFMYVEPVGGDIKSEANAFTTPWHLWVVNAPIFALSHVLTQEQWQQALFQPSRCWASSLLLLLYGISMACFSWFRAWFSVSCVDAAQCTQQWLPVELLVEGVSFQSFGLFIKVFTLKAGITLCVISAIGSWAAPLRRHVPRLGAVILGSGRRWVYVYLLHWALLCVPAARTGVPTLLFGDLETIPRSYIIEPAALCIAFGASLVLGSRLTELLFCWLMLLPKWVCSCCFLPASQARGRRAGPPTSAFVPEPRAEEVATATTADEAGLLRHAAGGFPEAAKQSANAWLASLPKTPGFIAGRPRGASQATLPRTPSS